MTITRIETEERTKKELSSRQNKQQKSLQGHDSRLLSSRLCLTCNRQRNMWHLNCSQHHWKYLALNLFSAPLEILKEFWLMFLENH